MVEVHRRPSQPFWLAPVSAESLFRSAVPSATGVPGVLAPEPAAHAVLLVAHAWADGLLGSVGQLLDAAALLAPSDHRDADSFARAWGWEAMWNTTLAVMDAVIGGKRPSLGLKLWTRHLLDVRERVVLENHISRLAAPVWSLPASEVPRAIACALRYTAAPEQDEDWTTQLRRSCLAIAHAFRPLSDARAKPGLDRTTNDAGSPTLEEGASPQSGEHCAGRRGSHCALIACLSRLTDNELVALARRLDPAERWLRCPAGLAGESAVPANALSGDS